MVIHQKPYSMNISFLDENARLIFHRCSVLNITGFSSPHKEDVINTNDRCDPTRTSYVEFTDCGGAVIEEQPSKLAESIRLFLQGLGYSKKNNFELQNIICLVH